MRLGAGLIVCVILSACGGEAEARRGSGDLRAAIEDWDETGTSSRPSTTVDRRQPGHDDPPRPRGTSRARTLRTHVVDVRFDGADLHNALRFLADEAGVSLVIGDGVAGRVDDRLVRVDAYQALVSLARAHGATVERRGRVVIVRAAR